MARTNIQEMLQVYAFAYFAYDKDYQLKDYGGKPVENTILKYADGTDNHHAERFMGSLDNPSVLRKVKAQFLSSKFDETRLVETYGKFDTIKGTFKQHVNTTYIIAKELLQNRTIPINSYEGYIFLDQNDPFTLQLKDEFTEKMKSIFGNATMSAELFSSVDAFLVKKTEIPRLLSESRELLGKEVFLGEEYFNFFMENYKKKILYPISLKLPNLNEARQNIIIKQIIPPTPEATNIDPVLKFFKIVTENPSKIDKYIDDFIDIEYNKFNLKTQAWEFPFRFNYDKIIDPTTKKPILDGHILFKLFTWASATGGLAGWNGKFHVTKEYINLKVAHNNWLGGISPASFLYVMKSHSKYKEIMKEMVKIRENVFYNFLKTLFGNSNIYENSAHYKKISKMIKEERFLIKKDANDIIKYFVDLSKQPMIRSFDGQKTALAFFRLFTMEVKGMVGKAGERMFSHYFINIIADFSAAQLSYFLFRGGKTGFLELKKQIFLMVYGLLSKKYAVSIDTDPSTMKTVVDDLFKKEIKLHGKKVFDKFKVLPHIIIS